MPHPAESRNIRVGLVQINNSFSGQNYLPYSVGILQAYCEKHLQSPELYEFLLPVYRRLPVQEAVRQIEDADVVFFSVYVWNYRISLEIARTFKQRHPDRLVVFGGPQVPDQAEDFVREHRFVDVAVHGEGEQICTALLENLSAGDWRGIPSLSFLDAAGAIVHTALAPRLRDLGTVPSPYLSGVFEKLMAANPDEHWIALWETNRGCPFSCTFCDWGSATQAKLYQFELERLYQEMEWFARERIEFVFCADANFGILQRDLDIARFAADTKARSGYPKALSVQNTKNATERAYQVQKILSDSGLNKGVTLSMQSLDPVTLQSIKRANISTDSYQELQRRFSADGIETYSDLILGLPGETYDSFVDGVAQLVERGQHNRIQFNNLSILPNAAMGNPEYQRTYGMVTVESRVVNIHGSLTASPEEIYETQQLVIATDSMPAEDWVRARAFCWLTALLHFDKVLQIPLVVLHELLGAGYREMLEVFSAGSLDGLPTLAEVRSFFEGKARDIQSGGEEYCPSEQWLGIWWPADEYMLINLAVDGKLDAFYAEAEELLLRFVGQRSKQLPLNLLHELTTLNRKLLKEPFQMDDLEIELTYNVIPCYQAALQGQHIALDHKPSRYRVDRASTSWTTWDSWFREVIWWGNKKGAYLYGNAPVEYRELAGHF
ncbi:MAG: B12-binding domain-containing radical SAM protein [Chloroflexota bacterium]